MESAIQDSPPCLIKCILKGAFCLIFEGETNYIIRMKRLESQEDYLEKILQISKEKENVHAIDIARALSFSKPSVSLAMNKLKELGYIEINNKGEITLSSILIIRVVERLVASCLDIIFNYSSIL